MAHIPTYPPLKGPLVARPEHLSKYTEPVTELVNEVLDTEEDYWGEDPQTQDPRSAFGLSVAAPTNDRFLVMFSVDNDDEAEDPHNVQLAEQVIQKIEQKFPELVDWMDWKFAPP